MAIYRHVDSATPLTVISARRTFSYRTKFSRKTHAAISARHSRAISLRYCKIGRGKTGSNLNQRDAAKEYFWQSAARATFIEDEGSENVFARPGSLFGNKDDSERSRKSDWTQRTKSLSPLVARLAELRSSPGIRH